VLEGFERFDLKAVMAMSRGIVLLLGVLIVRNASLRLSSVVLLLITANAASLAVGAVMISRKVYRFHSRFGLEHVRQVVRMSYPFVFAGLVGVAFQRIDIVMLSTMAGDEPTAMYGAVYQMFQNYPIVPGLFAATLFPILSRLHGSSTTDMAKLVDRALKLLLIVGVPMSIFSIGMAEELVLTVFGQRFLAAASAFRILAVSVSVFFVNSLLGRVMFSADKERVYLKMVTISLALNIFLNLVLIPRFSYQGAAWATTISYLFTFCWHYLYVNIAVFRVRVCYHMIKPVIACVPFLLVILILKTSLALGALAFLLLYFPFLMLLRPFDAEDKAIVHELLALAKTG
jgi:O-antigen/teichoic acid export membrane protein